VSDLNTILQKLDLLGLEDTKRVGEGVSAHLEEMDEIAAYDAAKASDEPVESLETVLARYSKPKN